MTHLTRSLLIGLLLLSCIGCDQVTKDLAQQHLSVQAPLSWFHNTIRLEYAENNGAFLSAGAWLPREVRIVVFQVGVGLVLAGLLLWLVRTKNMSTLPTIGWCLVLSGGVGNLLDRMFHDGRVIDFMNLGIGSFRTGIFNIADIYITVGAFVLICEYLEKAGRRESRRF